MQLNALPRYDTSVNTTGCCPRFNPEGWEGQELRFRDKPFLRATTRAVMHVPVDMGRVFSRVQARMEESGAMNRDDFIVLSRDLSPWRAEHLFAVSKPVAGEEMTTLSGIFLTRVFEGPYREAKHWQDEMEALARAEGHDPKAVYFFYTTCPRCAKAYGRNYVVGLVQV
ncbi:hydrolase [Actibacterium sp. MT2.3-13A]|uniref:hydrolase n=1 Tax=Actibacterium sp. MT2.3-13A TaxID=2828332 RepID=UPI001BAD6543|nr:hydrolase [Actibacterium sp. MT2.3-13A]